MKPLINPDQTNRSVIILKERYETFKGPWHSHRRAQLVYASKGVLTVYTRKGLWVVPPNRAVWILPGITHRICSRKKFWLCTLYVKPSIISLPKQCCVVAVDHLLQELLKTAANFDLEYPLGGREERLIQVILDYLPLLQIAAPLHLPYPNHPKLKKITEILKKNLTNIETLNHLTSTVGITVRHATRLFTKETGLTIGQWRQQLRLLTALEHLGQGESVTNVALEIGYSDVSSFIASFKKAFGKTPARYFR